MACATKLVQKIPNWLKYLNRDSQISLSDKIIPSNWLQSIFPNPNSIHWTKSQSSALQAFFLRFWEFSKFTNCPAWTRNWCFRVSDPVPPSGPSQNNPPIGLALSTWLSCPIPPRSSTPWTICWPISDDPDTSKTSEMLFCTKSSWRSCRPFVDQSLVNLAIGTLGRFLSGNSCGDNNLRYVAPTFSQKSSQATIWIRAICFFKSRNINQPSSPVHDADTSIRNRLLICRSCSSRTSLICLK